MSLIPYPEFVKILGRMNRMVGRDALFEPRIDPDEGNPTLAESQDGHPDAQGAGAWNWPATSPQSRSLSRADITVIGNLRRSLKGGRLTARAASWASLPET
jgi:hypothetical protein